MFYDESMGIELFFHVRRFCPEFCELQQWAACAECSAKTKYLMRDPSIA
jgi:hypothetical protein